MPSGMLATAAATDNTIAYIKIPGRMYRQAVAYRIAHDDTYSGDTRVRNRARDAARAANKTAKADKYAKIPALKEAGMTKKEIAAKLGLSESTIKRHWK
jgi:DNA-binding NarL/FixJ family response regulator